MVNFLNKAILDREKVADEVVPYEEAPQALDHLKVASKRGECPDLIFLDINMPKMNGWDFMEAYDDVAVHCADTIVIMLTSSIDPSDEARAIETKGISEYRSKPLTSGMIGEIWDQYFG